MHENATKYRLSGNWISFILLLFSNKLMHTLNSIYHFPVHRWISHSQSRYIVILYWWYIFLTSHYPSPCLSGFLYTHIPLNLYLFPLLPVFIKAMFRLYIQRDTREYMYLLKKSFTVIGCLVSSLLSIYIVRGSVKLRGIMGMCIVL